MTLDNAGDTSLLLGNDEVPPVLEQNAQGRSPFLLTADHYGRLIPRALGDLGVPAGELTRHIAWDIGIAGVAEALSNAARRASDRAALFAAGDRLQPAARRAKLDSRDVGGDGHSRQRKPCATARPRRGARQIFDPYHRRITEVIDARLRAGHADRAGGAAQLYAGLCRRRAALAYRHAVSSRHTAAAAAAANCCARKPISWSATTSPMR